MRIRVRALWWNYNTNQYQMRHSSFISVMATAAAAVISCGEKNIEPQPEVIPLSLSTSELSFDSMGGASQTVEVKSSDDWTATPKSDWIKVTKADDGSSFDVSAEDNTGDDDQGTKTRSGRILVSSSTGMLYVAVSQDGISADDALCRKILANIGNVSDGSASKSIPGLLARLGEDGKFSGIDYEDTNNGNWSQASHTSYMRTMAIAYTASDSPLRGSEELYAAIVKAYTLWADNDFTSKNWWYQHIDTPQKIGQALCVLRSAPKQLPDGLESKLLSKFLTKPTSSSYFTGANKQDISLGWIYLYTLQKNVSKLKESVGYYFEPYVQSTATEGFQHDWSYLIHGPQFYNLQYGSVPVTSYVTVASYLAGTSLENKTVTEFLGEFITKGIMPLYRGRSKLFTAAGRMAFSYSGSLYSSYSIPYAQLATLLPSYADRLNDAAVRKSGSVNAGYNLEPMHYHYWRADYTVHQRPGYTLGVRGCSKDRVCICEINTNGCNWLGYLESFGSMDICVDGEEYVDIFNVWKYDHVPGVTCPTGYSVEDFPHPSTSGQIYPAGAFCGGVTDGKYGCMVYNHIDNVAATQVTARKGYFFFDNEAVCLGSGISSNTAREIHTTVNQCNLYGDVLAEDASGTSSSVSSKDFSDLRWLYHDRVCYFFPENASVSVRAEAQSGRWSDVNTGLGYTTDLETKNVMLLNFNHGVNPQDGKYAYYVVPGKGSISEGKASLDDIAYLNSEEVQWVYNKSLDMLQAIFYQAGTVSVDGVQVSASEPAVIMVSSFKGSGTTVYAADPSYNRSSVTIGIGGKSVTLSYQTSLAYKGKTVSVTL